MVSDKETAFFKKGNFTYVGLDIDTTGRRLIDEIVNIAAFTKDAEFSQHIMPLMNLNLGARQRHQIRVINVGCFRMLKSTQTYKVIKTKTEIAALLDFLDWLEKVNTNDGIIFVYHDQLKFTPYMVIEAMKKYRLMERFQKIVKSFVNGCDLETEKQGGNCIKYLNLSQNYEIQMKKLGMECKELNEFEGDATVRAKLSYEICMLMAHGGEKKELDEKAMEKMVNSFIREKARPISTELAEIAEQEECIKRQSSLREIFRTYFQASRHHRRRGVTFRRLLAEASHDNDSLEKLWTEGKREAIATEVKKLETLPEEDQEELIELLDSHFDPEKKAVKLIVPRRESTSDGSNMRNNGNGQRNNGNRGNGNSRNFRRRSQRNQRGRSPRSRSMNKENQGPRSQSRRNNSTGDKNMNNNNNNNVMEPKSGAVRKEHHHQVDANQNTLAAAN